jgi:hypothetical protein
MRLATAFSLTLALGLSLSACAANPKDEGTPEAGPGGSGGERSGSSSRSSSSTEKADAAVKGTGGSVAPDAGLGTSGSAGRDGGVATGGAGGTSFQGGSDTASTGAGNDGGVASGGTGGSSNQAGAGDAGVARAGGSPGGTGGSSSSSGRSNDPSCQCVGTAIECLCFNQGYYCKPNVSDFTSGATQYNTLVEYADCNVTVVETGGSSGREILIYDRATGTLVGRKHFSDIIEPCTGSRVLGGGKWPDSTCTKSKCTEGPWAGKDDCAWVPETWEKRFPQSY